MRHHSEGPKHCANGHRPGEDGRCRVCRKLLDYADGLHVHDPRSDREKERTDG
jgi:hypothetical protein